jgi:hypothetical protein
VLSWVEGAVSRSSTLSGAHLSGTIYTAAIAATTTTTTTTSVMTTCHMAERVNFPHAE